MTDTSTALGYRGADWESGPAALLYDALADAALDLCPIPLAGARVLDLGAGTGSATKAALRRGAVVAATDLSVDMLAHRRRDRPPAAAADMVALPFAAGAFDAVIAAFSLAHIEPPEGALAEAGRVMRPGAALVATSFASTDRHAVKAVAERALVARGWTPPAWYAHLKEMVEPVLTDPIFFASAATSAGLAEAHARVITVDVGRRTPAELVRWRLGMASAAAFVDQLGRSGRRELEAEIVAGLDPGPVQLTVDVSVLTARR